MRLKTIFAFLTLTVLVIFACKKDTKLLDGLQENSPPDSPEQVVDMSGAFGDDDIDTTGFDLKRDHPLLHRKLMELEEELQANRSDGLGNFDFDNVLLQINDDSLYTHVYTVPVEGAYGNAFYNLIIEEGDQGNFNQPYLFKYILSFDFLEDFRNGLTEFNEFEGVIQKLVVDSDALRNGEDFDECWTVVFGDIDPRSVFTNIGSNPNLPGGGGDPNGNWGDWHSNGNTNGVVLNVNIGSGGSGSCWECEPCNCANHFCGADCTCGANGAPGKHQWYWYFDPSCAIYNFGPSGDGSNRDLTFDECVRLLIECGIFIPDEILEECETCPDPEPPTSDEIECVADLVMGFMADHGVPLCAVTKQGTKALGDLCCEADDPAGCMADDFFSDPVMSTLFQDLQPDLQFEDEELCFLTDEENQDLVDEIDDFSNENPNDDEFIKKATKFLNTSELQLSFDELSALLFGTGIPCNIQEEFNAFAWDIIFRTYFSKEPGTVKINLAHALEVCFGTPDQNGDYIDCNSTGNSTFSFTLYVEQPNPGTRDAFSGTPGIRPSFEIGHTNISLSTNYGGTDKTLTFGYYPANGVDPDNPSSPMGIFFDGGHNYHVSLTMDLTCGQFNDVINASINASNTDYHVGDYNCTDYGIVVANSVGAGIVEVLTPVIYEGKNYGTLSNPGDLGEDLKSNTNGTLNINNSGDSAPESTCY